MSNKEASGADLFRRLVSDLIPEEKRADYYAELDRLDGIDVERDRDGVLRDADGNVVTYDANGTAVARDDSGRVVESEKTDDEDVPTDYDETGREV